MNFKKTASKLILALSIVTGFASCSKDDSSEQKDSINARTAVQLTFVDSLANNKSAGSKIDLTKVAIVKIQYVVNDGNNGTNVVREAELIMTGDSTKVSSLDRRVLNFTGGSKLSIHSAALYNSNDELLGVASMTEPDVFEVSSPEGVTIMERTYGTIGVKK